jgi:hypothetical protein
MGCCYQYTCDENFMLIYINSVPSTESGCLSDCYSNCYNNEACRGQTAHLYSPTSC